MKALNADQFAMFKAVDKDTDEGPVEVKELPPDKAGDYAYWMNASNPDEHYHVRH